MSIFNNSKGVGSPCFRESLPVASCVAGGIGEMHIADLSDSYWTAAQWKSLVHLLQCSIAMQAPTRHFLLHKEGVLGGQYWPCLDGFIFKPNPENGDVFPDVKPTVKFPARLLRGD